MVVRWAVIWGRNIRSWNMQNAWQIAPYLAKLQENWRFLYGKRNIIYPLHAARLERTKILAGLLALAHSFCGTATPAPPSTLSLATVQRPRLLRLYWISLLAFISSRSVSFCLVCNRKIILLSQCMSLHIMLPPSSYRLYLRLQSCLVTFVTVCS